MKLGTFYCSQILYHPNYYNLIYLLLQVSVILSNYNIPTQNYNMILDIKVSRFFAIFFKNGNLK